MKIKTLLVAGLAFVAMNAVAQDIHVTEPSSSRILLLMARRALGA